jgi:hypothetical protein
MRSHRHNYSASLFSKSGQAWPVYPLRAADSPRGIKSLAKQTGARILQSQAPHENGRRRHRTEDFAALQTNKRGHWSVP